MNTEHKVWRKPYMDGLGVMVSTGTLIKSVTQGSSWGKPAL